MIAKIIKENKYLRKVLSLDKRMEIDVEEIKGKCPLIKSDWLSDFNELKMPASIREMLLIAKNKKELKQHQPSSEAKIIEKMELLVLNGSGSDTISGSGEIIAFDPSSIDDPFAEILKDEAKS